MATQTLSKFRNVIRWENDKKSFRQVKKETMAFKKELQSLKSEIKKTEAPKDGITGGAPAQQRQRADAMKAHVRAREKNLKQEAKFKEFQEEAIHNFFLSNKAIRNMSDSEKKIIAQQLRQIDNAKELRKELRKRRTLAQDNLQEEKRITREKERQNVFASRMNSSTEQLLGTFLAIEAGSAIIKTGMDFEAVNKSLIAVSENTEAAGENFEFIREEARRLGIDLVQAGKGYAKLLASGRGKIGQEEVRELFSAVSEAGTVLGLSQDDLAGATRA